MEKITKEYFCDRCGCKIKEPFKDPTATIQRLHYTYNNGLSHIADCKDDIRLCSDCALRLLKLLNLI